MTRAWFPMTTAALVRDRRYVELRLKPEEWEGTREDADFLNALQADPDGTEFVVGYWWADEERSWWLCNKADLGDHSGFNAIDDDFTGWRNLTPIYPDNIAPEPPGLADQVAHLTSRFEAHERRHAREIEALSEMLTKHAPPPLQEKSKT